MSDASRTALRDRGFVALAVPLALAKLTLHLALSERYGYHRDELYFIACGEQLDFGYVDHPPFVPFVARVVGGAFGYGLFGLRPRRSACRSTCASPARRSRRPGRRSSATATGLELCRLTRRHLTNQEIA